jgi:UDP-N-acetylglucosamine 2-epimerase (non-hydrolysing)
MKKIISVVGARPNFMKVAPLHDAFRKYPGAINHLICHTGQHYDEKMSKVFFEELNLPQPHFFLGVGSGSHAVQTARIMVEFEKILQVEKPDLVIVVGDVNSTIACSLVAKKLRVPVAHVEAGLRSFDMNMPEEINRILTDAIADFLFVTEEAGLINLQNEGIANEKVFFAGNVMIDSLVKNLGKIDRSQILATMKLEPREFILTTLHRPSNVDDKDSLIGIIQMLNKYAVIRKIVFPIHPRTRKHMLQWRLLEKLSPNIILCEPIGYIDFLCLVRNAALLLTDSGGIQEETTFLGIPCVTLRENTERPVTIEMGTNYLVGTDLQQLDKVIDLILQNKSKTGRIPPLWDGRAAERICQQIAILLGLNLQPKPSVV